MASLTMIDRSSPVPLYYQLKQILLKQIMQGVWKPGEMIPSEQELQDTYFLSRTTVRQTLLELAYEGHLTRQRGRGTFVALPKVTHSPQGRHSITFQMEQQGVKPGWKLMDKRWVMPSKEVQAQLKTQVHETVFRIRRLRLADDAPLGYLVSYLPQAVAGAVDHEALESGESLYYLHNVVGIDKTLAYRTIEAIGAGKSEMHLLEAEEGTPILQIERLVVYRDSGAPVEFMQARYRGDRFKYQVALETSPLFNRS